MINTNKETEEIVQVCQKIDDEIYPPGKGEKLDSLLTTISKTMQAKKILLVDFLEQKIVQIRRRGNYVVLVLLVTFRDGQGGTCQQYEADAYSNCSYEWRYMERSAPFDFHSEAKPSTVWTCFNPNQNI